jgi:hypothetical protein
MDPLMFPLCVKCGKAVPSAELTQGACRRCFVVPLSRPCCDARCGPDTHHRNCCNRPGNEGCACCDASEARPIETHTSFVSGRISESEIHTVLDRITGTVSSAPIGRRLEQLEAKIQGLVDLTILPPVRHTFPTLIAGIRTALRARVSERDKAQRNEASLRDRMQQTIDSEETLG